MLIQVLGMQKVKTARLGIKGSLLGWIKEFLTRRTMQPTHERLPHAESKLVTRGVPQGSVLSHILFNIMMADFPKPQDGCKLALFADDIEFHVTAASLAEAQRKLSKYLWRIENWARRWRLSFSIPKCAAMVITRKKKRTEELQLTLARIPIQVVTSFKFLEVIFNSSLTWAEHINSVAEGDTPSTMDQHHAGNVALPDEQKECKSQPGESSGTIPPAD